jgi:hypothetical protein
MFYNYYDNDTTHRVRNYYYYLMASFAAFGKVKKPYEDGSPRRHNISLSGDGDTSQEALIMVLKNEDNLRRKYLLVKISPELLTMLDGLMVECFESYTTYDHDRIGYPFQLNLPFYEAPSVSTLKLDCLWGEKQDIEEMEKILSLPSGYLTDTNHKDKYIADIDEDGFSFKVIPCSFQEMIKKAKDAEICPELWMNLIISPRMNIYGRNRSRNEHDDQLFTIAINCDNRDSSYFDFPHDRFWEAISKAAFWISYVRLPWMIQENARGTSFGELAMSALIKNR